MTVRRLKACATVIADPAPLSAPPRSYVALESVEGGTGRLAAGFDLPIRPPDAPGQSAAEPGDVLFGKLRPYLAKSLLVTEPVFASAELLCLRPGELLVPRWFSYVAQSRPFIEWAVATSEGVKMPRTSWEKLAEYRAEIPSLPVQQATADYLDAETSRIYALIAKKRRWVELARTREAAVIEGTIRGLVESHGSTPLKYSVRRVEVGIVVTPAAWYEASGVLALRSLNVRPGGFVLDDIVNITPEGHAQHTKSELHAGDVVVVRTGQAGAAAVIPPALEGCNCIDLVIVRPSRRIEPKFLEYVLNSDWTQKHIEEHSVGTIQSHFNVGAMKAVPVPVPPIENQRKVLARLAVTSTRSQHLVDMATSQIDLLVEHRQALITAAVTGELEIPRAAA